MSFPDYSEDNAELTIIDQLDFEIAYGELAAITGVSGSGKSTLLHLLGGLEQPKKGEVFLTGQSLYCVNDAQRDVWRRQKLGFIYQFHYLIADLTALENTALPLMINGMNKEKALEHAHLQLSDIGLSKQTQHYPAQLSGGERQRVAVARALIHRPQCLLADEPTGSLDHENASKVWGLLKLLCQKHSASLVLVTHDLHLAQQCDRHYQLIDGKLKPQSTQS